MIYAINILLDNVFVR